MNFRNELTLKDAGMRCARATAVLLLAAGCWSHAQNLDFLSDLNGNLTAQFAATAASPQILAQPQLALVRSNELASFFVVSTDTRGLAYQWRFNGTDIGGATNDTLLLAGVTITNEGQYSVVLVNSSGSVTSNPARLWIDSNGNGLPDTWELAHFGNLNQTVLGDFDHDGVSNYQEFIDGTDPTDPNSLAFRLVLIKDGGAVQVTPSKPSYTNGEPVTVAVTSFAPGWFRGFTGDVTTTNTSFDLVMSTNYTVFARFRSYDLLWTNASGDDWNNPNNWSIPLRPSTNDNVFIPSSVTVTLNAGGDCGNLTLGSSGLPRLAGSGTLTLHGPSSAWINGIMSGSGQILIAPGATLYLTNSGNIDLGRTLENGGALVCTGSGSLALDYGLITNRLGALVDIQSPYYIYFGSGTPRIDNSGTFRKSGSNGIFTLGGFVPFNNYGALDVQAGTVVLQGGGFLGGAVTVQAGAVLNLNGGDYSSAADASMTGAGGLVASGATATFPGLVNLSGSNSFLTRTVNLTGRYICTNNTLVIGGNANFDGSGTVSPAVVNMSSGTIGGSNTVTVLNQMNWLGGGMVGAGRTVIAPSATLTLANAGIATLERTLENGGTLVCTGSGSLAMAGVLTNSPGALVDMQTPYLIYQGMGHPRIDNAGTFRKSQSTGLLAIGTSLPFSNQGTVDIQKGVLAMNGGYNPIPGSTLSVAIGGPAPGTDYGQLQVGGTVALNGSLGVTFINGYVPPLGSAFTILTAGKLTNAFANFYYPANAVTMQLSNTTTTVIVGVTGAVASRPILLAPTVSGSNVLLTWTAISNTTYRLEFSPDLNPSNWGAVAGDVTALSNTASKLDTLTPSNRLYRVHTLP